MVARSFDLEIAMTFGCHVLLRDYSTLTLISFISKIFPRPLRWFTICGNFFYTSLIVSPCFILKVSNSWISEFFRALLTSSVPSCVTWIKSHIFLAVMHADTLKNSSKFNGECIMFIALESYSLFNLFLWPRFVRFLYNLVINYMGWNGISINHFTPNASISKLHEDFHLNITKRVVRATKQWWFVNRCTLSKWQLIPSHNLKLLTKSWIALKTQALIPIVGSCRESKRGVE